ncbi:hypothetical protein ACQ3G6_05540 [Allorhizobium undicola]
MVVILLMMASEDQLAPGLSSIRPLQAVCTARRLRNEPRIPILLETEWTRPAPPEPSADIGGAGDRSAAMARKGATADRG